MKCSALESEDNQESLESVDAPENFGFTGIVVLLGGVRGSKGEASRLRSILANS